MNEIQKTYLKAKALKVTATQAWLDLAEDAPQEEELYKDVAETSDLEREAADALLAWGKTVVLPMIQTDDQREAIDKVFAAAATSLKARERVIDLVLKVDA